MRRVRRVVSQTLEAIGLISAALGACSMDSEDLRYPAAILLIGAIMLYIGYKVDPTTFTQYEEEWDEI